MTLAEITEHEGTHYRVDETTGCWEWLKGKTKHGYPFRHAHRLYWAAVNGPIPEGHHVHHACRNPGCVNPAHLECITAQEHVNLHLVEKRILTVDEGRRMRELLLDPDMTYDDIAAVFGVSYQYVYEVAYGKRFKEISPLPVPKPPRICGNRHCSNDITDMRRNARYCSPHCRTMENQWKSGITPTPAKWGTGGNQTKRSLGRAA